MLRPALFCLLAAACGSSTSGMSGPTISGRVGGDSGDSGASLQSNDIMARDKIATKVVVRHILIGWRDLASAYPEGMDRRAAARSREEADALASTTLAKVRAGEDMQALMRAISEDKGSAASGATYDVTPDAKLVFEFKRLSLRLNVGEAGMVKTLFGWHVIKRFE